MEINICAQLEKNPGSSGDKSHRKEEHQYSNVSKLWRGEEAAVAIYPLLPSWCPVI